MKAGLLPKLLLSPSALLVLVCVYGYIMFTFYLSFTSSTMLPAYDIVGGGNYTRLLGSQNWHVSIANLGVFAGLYIMIALALGLGLAILIDQKIRAESAIRSIFLYPMALSFIVTGTAWKWLLDPGVGLERSMHQIGWESFSAILTTEHATPSLPIYAIGGLAQSDIDDARRAGAHGVAAIRAMGTTTPT